MDLNKEIELALQFTQGRWCEQPQRAGIHIGLDCALGDLPPICGTESGVHEIVANLVFNAVEAMPEGGQIRIRAATDEGYVRLSFSDTGRGMDEETRRRAFEPFFTTKAAVGSGLGLSSLHGMVTHWGGRAEVESEVGTGTTFRLWFPVWRQREHQGRGQRPG